MPSQKQPGPQPLRNLNIGPAAQLPSIREGPDTACSLGAQPSSPQVPGRASPAGAQPTPTRLTGFAPTQNPGATRKRRQGPLGRPRQSQFRNTRRHSPTRSDKAPESTGAEENLDRARKAEVAPRPQPRQRDSDGSQVRRRATARATETFNNTKPGLSAVQKDQGSHGALQGGQGHRPVHRR
jgi:hypothetical protein